ncbi:MAG: 16S rRNA (uracil(1498)-N(3))-methyltransferase [Sinobacteraceae bacterium]|nr:16S rRNA (uracil(1498)-N(3))-methyltransferase [Nevskiaceae bacterium]
MTRLYLPQTLQEGQSLELPPAAARHVVQVLRLASGAGLTLFNGRGGEFEAVLERVGRRDAAVCVGAYHAVERESNLQLTLAQCVSKGDRMDYGIQKAVELGVHKIVPLLSARSVVKLDAGRWHKKHDHWQAVVASACEQCGRNRLPGVAAPLKLMDWLPQSQGVRLILAPGAVAQLQSLPLAHAATLLVGPEGGFTAEEITCAQERGCIPIGLGPRVLRTETAGVATLAALQALWGDF